MTWNPRNGTQPVVCGHRGAPAIEPENTMASFRSAAAHGATWVEFDVRPTGDGELVIHHDPTTAAGVHIGSAPSNELEDWIPNFQDLAQGLPQLGFDIEMKTDDIAMSLADYADLVIEQIDSHCAQPSHLIVTSFDVDALVEVRQRRPDLAIGLLYWNGDDDDAIERALRDGHVAIAPSIKLLSEATMAKARAADLAVMTWTVNDPGEVARASALGVDMIIGDDPRVIAANL